MSQRGAASMTALASASLCWGLGGRFHSIITINPGMERRMEAFVEGLIPGHHSFLGSLQSGESSV